jgi:phosphatidylethanolamine/phosphatidyl-N-methylethanolamine N-methyltransferase
MPARSKTYTAAASNRVWLNLPPARVWVYRKR